MFMSSSARLSVELRHRLGALELDVRFRAEAVWTILFGPSGSGKSTILRAVAGGVRPREGRIAIGDEVVLDRGVFVAAHRRPVRLAPQAAALFPRMTVRENIGFGAGERMVAEALGRFRLAGLEAKYPRQLSGGEQKRVAVVRAAASAVTRGAGTVLLLDEPFAGLDARVRDELLGQLMPWLAEAGVATLSVTHDVGEAFLIGAEVVRIAEGRVLAEGAVSAVLAEDRERLLGLLR